MTAVYFWLGLGLLLVAAETLMPGAFLLWVGLAGIATGLTVWVLPASSGITQMLIFAGYSAATVLLSRKLIKAGPESSDQPLLNRRAEQLVGRTFPLDGAIANGQGKLKVGDALWSVSGADQPAGTAVTVVGVDGMVLKVERAAS